jgi:integrase/recombinase XerD
MLVDHNSVNRFAECLKSRGKQPSTVESYCRDANRFLEFLNASNTAPSQVDPNTLVAYQNFLKSDCSERENSVRRAVIGVRQFYRFLSDSHHIQATPFDSVPIPSRDETLPNDLSDDDIDNLLQVALSGKPDFKAARDAAIVSLLAHEGLKANEVIALTWRDYVREGNRGWLHVAGTKARSVPLSDDTNAFLDGYKRYYEELKHPAILNCKEKRMFIAFKGRDAASPLPVMTRHGLKFILYEIGEKVGLSHLNTEQLRHFAVNYLMSLGKTPEEIMAHLGLRRLGNIAKHFARKKKHLANGNGAVAAGAVAAQAAVISGALNGATPA